MGYSTFIQVRSKIQREKMLSFMAHNYRPWAVVVGKGKAEPEIDFMPDLGFDNAKNALGFCNAGSLWGWDRAYVFSTLRWMAIQVGARKTRFKKDTVEPSTFREGVPFLVCDDDFWPILICNTVAEAMKLPPKQRWCATDAQGVYRSVRTNESIVSACDELLFNERRYAQFQRAIGKLGAKTPATRGRWMCGYQKLKLKFNKPEIDRKLPLLRGEMRRLERLWEATL
jgi:hypothetical protein